MPWLAKLVVFLFLGAVINVAVAWAFADLIPRRHWTRTEFGLTVDRGAGWYLGGYEGLGFKWEVGWPVLDIDAFYGERLLKFRGYPTLRGHAVNLDDWSGAFAEPPRMDTTPRLLRIEDSCGWPFHALGRTITMDLTEELKRLDTSVVYQDDRAWPMSEYDLASWSGRPADRWELLDDAALPIQPLWTGFMQNTLIYAGACCLLYVVCASFRWLTRDRSLYQRAGVVASIIMFSVLGTIADAWACANWGSIGTQPQRYGGDGTEGSGGGLGVIWKVQRNERFGVTRLESKYFVNAFGSFILSLTPAESLLPLWADQRLELGESDHRIVLYAAGWPLRALQCRVEFDHVSDGITLEGRLDQPRAQNVQMPALPYRPIWFGFIGNTLLFALAATSVLAAFGSVTRFRRWRRVRRGGCSMCGYDLRGDSTSGCPECGWRRADVS